MTLLNQTDTESTSRDFDETKDTDVAEFIRLVEFCCSIDVLFTEIEDHTTNDFYEEDNGTVLLFVDSSKDAEKIYNLLYRAAGQNMYLEGHWQNDSGEWGIQTNSFIDKEENRVVVASVVKVSLPWTETMTDRIKNYIEATYLT